MEGLMIKRILALSLTIAVAMTCACGGSAGVAPNSFSENWKCCASSPYDLGHTFYSNAACNSWTGDSKDSTSCDQQSLHCTLQPYSCTT